MIGALFSRGEETPFMDHTAIMLLHSDASPCQPRAIPTSKAGHSQGALLSEERPVSSLTP